MDYNEINEVFYGYIYDSEWLCQHVWAGDSQGQDGQTDEELDIAKMHPFGMKKTQEIMMTMLQLFSAWETAI